MKLGRPTVGCLERRGLGVQLLWRDVVEQLRTWKSRVKRCRLFLRLKIRGSMHRPQCHLCFNFISASTRTQPLHWKSFEAASKHAPLRALSLKRSHRILNGILKTCIIATAIRGALKLRKQSSLSALKFLLHHKAHNQMPVNVASNRQVILSWTLIRVSWRSLDVKY